MTKPPQSYFSPMARNSVSKRHRESGFDGNRTDIISGWYFPNENWDGLQGSILDGLMEMTRDGNLYWCVFLTGAKNEQDASRSGEEGTEGGTSPTGTAVR